MNNTENHDLDNQGAKLTSALQFLQKDYELWLGYISAHLGRMWQRFNFFIVLESGLSAALWLWLKDAFSDDAKVAVDPARGIALIGLATSVVWYMFGAQDRRLFVVYQKQVEEIARVLDSNLELSSLLKQEFKPVGNQRMPIKQKWFEYLYQWRWEYFSTTKLAAWFPLFVTFYWIGTFIWIKK